MNINQFLAMIPTSKKIAVAQEVVKEYMKDAAVEELSKSDAIQSPGAVADYIRSFLNPDDFRQEVFGYVAFNIRMQPTECKIVFRGFTDEVAVNTGVLFRFILTGSDASRFIIFHTHPSGKSDPSEADIHLTERVVKTARVMQLVCLDHIIMAAGEHHSLSDSHYSSF
jgi:DNA repair protein RadC